ncbi:MAG: porin family protein, partial [Gemmatimonadota bacterium]|nr:porin family protein [Gemmatimonadota bacterium]
AQWQAVRRRAAAPLAAAAVLALGGAGATPLAAQEPTSRVFVEGLAGGVIPTFEISDVVTAGPAFGAAVGYRLSPKLTLMGEFDYGMHEAEGNDEVDITTMHYIAKVGYSLLPATDRGWEALVNLGAGAVTFDVDGGEANTYFAINAGGKVAYNFSPRFALVLSPQGDIAFTDEEEVGTSNAWVWPVTAGVRVKL